MAGPIIRDFATSKSVVEASSQQINSGAAMSDAATHIPHRGRHISNHNKDSARAIVEGLPLEPPVPCLHSETNKEVVTQTYSPTSTPPSPTRLLSWIPPKNFGAIEPGVLFRSAYPSEENYGYIKHHLRVKTILTLVAEPIPDSYTDFMVDSNISHKTIHVPANKEGIIKITADLMQEVLAFVLDRSNHPLLIHCNRGKHRTGCVTASFRKVLSHSNKYALAEYRDYASPKERADDIRFIEGYDPSPLRMLAQRHGWVFTPPPEPTLEYWHFNKNHASGSPPPSLEEMASIKLPDSDYS